MLHFSVYISHMIYMIFSSKTFNLCLSACISVHISVPAVYSAMLQTKHVIILFYSSRFSLPVNSFFLSTNTVFAISIVSSVSSASLLLNQSFL